MSGQIGSPVENPQLWPLVLNLQYLRNWRDASELHREGVHLGAYLIERFASLSFI